MFMYLSHQRASSNQASVFWGRSFEQGAAGSQWEDGTRTSSCEHEWTKGRQQMTPFWICDDWGLQCVVDVYHSTRSIICRATGQDMTAAGICLGCHDRVWMEEGILIRHGSRIGDDERSDVPLA
jgi:hypothetical protein